MKEKVIRHLKRRDRTLLEMQTGMLLYGLVCQVVGLFFAGNAARYTLSLWTGVYIGLISSILMARTLDRALLDAAAAQKIITSGYLFRYFSVAVVFALIALAGIPDVLIVFLGYMGLKLAAYMQPLVHKFYNQLFHETDPVPQALPDEEGGEGVR